MAFEPVIKWSGSKRTQAGKIISYFPKEIDTYYEPFCGGASVLRRLLESDIKVNKYVCSDINKELINLWNEIKNNPDKLSKDYRDNWKNFKENREYYYEVRAKYNKNKNPNDYLLLCRTCVNGLSRWNKKEDFNSPVHHGRDGIIPETLDKIIHEWSELLNKNNVEFICQSYDVIQPKENDFMYLDPPYANTKGMYNGCIDYNILWEYLRKSECKYILSFDGKTNKGLDNTYSVPEDIYSEHIYLDNGKSKFRMLIETSNDTIVCESLYIK